MDQNETKAKACSVAEDRSVVEAELLKLSGIPDLPEFDEMSSEDWTAPNKWVRESLA